ncbi:Ig-like domain-containing protein [Rhodococcus spongiicola]|uniref:Ig-like domain-containing protein n=1 Tax=Rhodococcus spongiicola TaxID=2487352 RepID=UPI001F3206B2|nr:Ig-like domain-containing protein [Rhodococcus spongiicola]
MFSSTLRRVASPVLVTGSVIAALLGAGVGTAAASEPPPSSNTYNEDQLKLTKEVVGSNVVYPGDTVTFKTTVKHRANDIRLSIEKVRDVPPAGFILDRDSVKVTYVTWNDKHELNYNSDGGVTARCTDRCTFLIGGFDLTDNESVVLETTYRVPDDMAFGDYNSGALVGVNAWSGERGSKDFGVWVRVQDPNVTTTTTLDVPETVKTGEAATLTATLDPSNARGRVQFQDGGADIGSPVDVVGGVATLSHTFDTVGAHEITANFLADAGFHNSTSAPATVDVTSDTSTALQVPASALVGEDVTMTASITPDTATGRVQFKLDGNDYGQPVAVENGAASIIRSFPEALSHSITAEFTGTGGYHNSVSAPAEITVNDPDWGTTTVVEPVTAVTGTPVNLSATVLPFPSGGDVRFLVDGVEVGTAPVGTADGVAVLPHTFDVAGTANVVAEFTGTDGFEPSTSTEFAVTVNDPDTRTETRTVLEVSGKTVVGEQVTFTATVDPGTADGTVEFRSGTTVLGTVEVVDGVATFTHSFDGTGTHAVTASFVGGAGFADSVSGPTVLTVSEDSGAGPLGSLEALFG